MPIGEGDDRFLLFHTAFPRILSEYHFSPKVIIQKNPHFPAFFKHQGLKHRATTESRWDVQGTVFRHFGGRLD